MRPIQLSMTAVLPAMMTLLAGVLTSSQAQDSSSSKLPSGSYILLLKEGDQAPPQAIGEWELQLDSAGSYRWLRGADVMVEGDYRIQADTVLLVDRVGGELACEGTGRYLWHTVPEGLQFAEIEDSCGPRPILLGTRPLSRKR